MIRCSSGAAATGGLWEDGSRLLSASAVLMQQFVIGASVSVLSLAPPHSVFMCSAGELLQFSLPRPQEEVSCCGCVAVSQLLL